MPAIMMMADVLVKGGKIAVNQMEDHLSIGVTSSHLLNASKLANISKIIEGKDVDENISSYAPLYYLITYVKDANANIRLSGNELIIEG